MIQLNVSTLKEALRGCRYLNIRSNSPALLQQVRFETGKGQLHVSATDLDQTIVHTSTCPDDTPATSGIVPLEILRSSIRGLNRRDRIHIGFKKGGGRLTVETGGTSQSIDFSSVRPEAYPEPPDIRETLVELPAPVLQALIEARTCASNDPNRDILRSVCLDARNVVASDGRQLYHHNSLDLPLARPVLIPAIAVLQLFDATQEVLLLQGDTKETGHLYQLAQGPWKWSFKALDKTYPNWTAVQPDPESQRARFTLSEGDVHRITREMSKLPLCKVNNAPVTLVVKEHRASLFAGPKQEYPLEPENWNCGPEIAAHVSFNLEYLIQAVAKGLREVAFIDPLSPIMLRDEHREVIFMPLRTSEGEDGADSFVPSVPAASSTTTDRNNMQHTQPPIEEKKAPASTEGAESETPMQRLIREASDLREKLRGVVQTAREITREHAQLEKDHEALKRNIRSLQRIEV